MLKELLVSHAISTPRASEEQSLEYLFDLMMQFNRFHSAPAILDGAGPGSLHLDARVAVEAVAPGALCGEGLHHELAKAAHKEVEGGCEA